MTRIAMLLARRLRRPRTRTTIGTVKTWTVAQLRARKVTEL